MKHELRAKLTTQFEFVIGRGDRDRASVEQLCDLNRHNTETAGRSPDQHEVTRLDVRTGHQHAPYGDQYERNRGSFLEAQIGRLGQGVDRRDFAIFAVRAVERAGLEAPDPEIGAEVLFAARAVVTLTARDTAMDDDFIADFDVPDLAAGLDHHARGVGTRDMREQDFHAGQAAARPDVVEVASRGFDLDHDIVGACLRARGVPILENVTATVLLENNRFHLIKSLLFSASA